MAVTKKVTKKKTIKKKVKKIKPEEIIEDKRKYLSIEECRQLELGAKDSEIDKLKLQLHEFKTLLLESQVQVSKKNAELYYHKAEKSKNDRRSFNKQIASKYNLSGAWGFDPDSLEIKE